jgi:hypothetical protein
MEYRTLPLSSECGGVPRKKEASASFRSPAGNPDILAIVDWSDDCHSSAVMDRRSSTSAHRDHFLTFLVLKLCGAAAGLSVLIGGVLSIAILVLARQ